MYVFFITERLDGYWSWGSGGAMNRERSIFWYLVGSTNNGLCFGIVIVSICFVYFLSILYST